MYQNMVIGEEIYLVKFFGTTGSMDVRATGYIHLSIRVALAEYDGIPPLPQGDDLLSNENYVDTSGTDSDHGAGTDSDNDTFSRDFFAKCSIYLGDKLYKPKRSVAARDVDGNHRIPAAPVVGMTFSGIHKTKCTSRGQNVGFQFSSPVKVICQSDDLSNESNASDWEAAFVDFLEADPCSSNSDSHTSVAEPVILLGEIGLYSHDIENLPLKEKYVESKWESENWNFTRSWNTFSGSKLGPTSFYGRRTPALHSFFSLFWPKTTLDEIVKQTITYVDQIVHAGHGKSVNRLNGGQRWKKLTMKSFKTWLGIALFMGLKSELA